MRLPARYNNARSHQWVFRSQRWIRRDQVGGTGSVANYHILSGPKFYETWKKGKNEVRISQLLVVAVKVKRKVNLVKMRLSNLSKIAVRAVLTLVTLRECWARIWAMSQLLGAVPFLLQGPRFLVLL